MILMRLFFCLFYLIAASLANAAELRLAIPTPNISKGDPFERYYGGSVKSALFDGLTQISLSGEIKPALAISWRAVSDTEWIFHLRPNAVFSNGRSVTAPAIVAALDYLRTSEVQRSWMANQIKTVVSARAIDDLTLAIFTNAPDPLLARRMSVLAVPDMIALSKMGDVAFAENPIGTGPYRVRSWGPNGSIVRFTASLGSWRERKSISDIEMRVIADGSRRTQALLSGEVHLATNLDPDMLDLVKDVGLKTMVTANPIVIGIGLRNVNAEGSPMGDVRVRRALNYAVNKSAITEKILHGLMSAASQGVPPGTVGHNPSILPYTYDPDKARAMLAEAGYSNGFDMTIGIWTGQVPGDALIFQQVAQDLFQVGIRIKLQVMPFTEFSRRINVGDWRGIEAFSLTWSSRTMLDGQSSLEQYSCSRLPAAHFCDLDLDKAIDSVRFEMDQTIRTAKLQDAMAISSATAPSIFLVNYAEIAAMQQDVNGYEVRSDGIMFEKIFIGDELAQPR